MSEHWGLYGGRERKLVAKECQVCKANFSIPPHLSEKSLYCSRACSSKGQQKAVTVYCAQCKITFQRAPSKVRAKSGLLFCGRLCKEKAQGFGGMAEIQPSHYGTAVTPRRKLLHERGHRCEVCKLDSWMGVPIPIELDHIDGDAFNNEESNLRLLCPNCHAQTPTYKGRNHGKGRKSRKV